MYRLYHMYRNSYRSCLVSYRSCYRLSYPPCCIGGKLVTFLVIEFIDRFDKSEISFLYKVKEKHSLSHISLCYADYQAQVCFHKSFFSFFVSLRHLAGKNKFLFHRKQRYSSYLFQVHSYRVVNYQTFLYKCLLHVLGRIESFKFALYFLEIGSIHVTRNFNTVTFKRLVNLLNLVYVKLFVIECLKYFGLRQRSFLLSFLFMTGFSASSMRAGIMFALSLTAKLLGRTYDTATALAVAAALLLTENPAWIDDTGFQLSFTAALAASIAVPAFSRMDPIKDWLLKRSSGGNIQRYRQHGSVRFLKDSSPAALKKAFVCPRKDIPQALWKIAGTHLPALWNRLAETLSSGFRSSFCVSMVTLPLVLSSFYEWNVLSVAVNLVVIPLMGMLLGCCILLASLGGLLLTAGEEWLSLLAPAALPVKGILFLYETLCRLGSTGGIGLFRPGAPQLWQSLLFYVCLFALFCFAGKLPRIAGYVFCSLLCLIFLAGKPVGVQVTMLDVGQGDCIYIRTQEGEHYLCDGGSTSKLQTGTWQVIPFLKHQGVRRLELIFVSHCDTDHISAIRELLEWAGDGKAKIGGLVLAASGTEDEMRASLVEAAEKNGVPVYRMEAGDQIRRGSALFQAVYPFSENNASGGASTDRNASSLVLRFSQLRGSKTLLSDTDKPGEDHSEEAFSLLLTGDAEAGGEKQILDRCPELISGCTILKTAHHGSDTSTSQAFLDAVSPRAALISCGKDNSYGHPHEEVLSRLNTAGIPVFITAECGAITVRERNGIVTAETFLQPGAGRTEASAAGPADTG